MNPKEQDPVHGRCYCGEVVFTIESGTTPVLAGYCHCRDCRQAHAAPVYQYVYIEKTSFLLADANNAIKTYTRNQSNTDRFRRYFCSICGSKVFNYLKRQNPDGSTIELNGTFPSLFDDQLIATNEIWSPNKHVHCSESIMNLEQFNDDLPRF